MRSTLDTASIGRPITRNGVSIFPVYIHLGRTTVRPAEAHSISVTERPQAEVPTVQFSNPTDGRVLVPSGMVITGGRQNRVVNVPVILEPRTTIDVPVSCVQAGRWNGEQEFRYGISVAPRRVRRVNVASTAHALRRGQKRADQSAVWSMVSAELSLLGLSDASSNIEARHEALAHDQRRAEAVRELVELGPLPGQCGIVVAHGRRVVSADIFGSPELLAANYEALVTAALLEVMARPEGRPSVSAALRFVHRFATARADEVPGTGLGTEMHITTSRIAGQALVLDDAVVYASCFALAA